MTISRYRVLQCACHVAALCKGEGAAGIQQRYTAAPHWLGRTRALMHAYSDVRGLVAADLGARQVTTLSNGYIYLSQTELWQSRFRRTLNGSA